MRHSLLGFAGVGALLLAISACSEEEQFAPQSSELKHVTATIRAFETDADTRTDISIGSKVSYAWAATDTIGIFPDEGAQAYFSMASGAGSQTATFTGGGWALKEASQFMAYCPFVGDIYLNRTAVPVKYTGQMQTGDASTAHLGPYDYMAAAPIKPTNGSANFDFSHLGCIVILKLTLPQACTLTSVTLSAEDAVFATKGTVDLTTSHSAITATAFASSVRLDLKEVSTTEANQTLNLYMMLPPTDLSDKTLTVTATHQTAQKAVATVTGKTLQAGHAYAFTATMPAVDASTVVKVETAGTLSSLIGDDWDKITALSLSGPLNGDDIRFIREMAGRDKDGNTTTGSLTTLDIANASIVSGGGAYYYYFFNKMTTDNEIGEYMFYHTNLLSISLPLSVTTIGCHAFSNCEKLTEIDLPDNITSIGEYAFNDCIRLEKAKLSSNLKSIGSYTFYGCKRLTSIDLPESLTSIGGSAFWYCERLTSIVIPEGIKKISADTFYSCSKLSSVHLPSTLTEIDTWAFGCCDNLSSINLPSSITNIGESAFGGCYLLPNIEFPTSLKNIGNNAFQYCWSMTKVVLPDNLTDIGDNTFQNCTSLSELTIGKGVKSIGYEAFSGAPLTTVTCHPTTPPTVYDDAFTPKTGCTFYVPKGCKATYESSAWNTYFTTATELSE